MENNAPIKEKPTYVKVTKVKSKDVGYKVRRFYVDMENYLQVKMNDRIVQIKLKLKGDKLRLIGEVTKSTRTITMRRNQSKHLYRKGNSYGFNDFVLRYAFTFDTIALSDDMGNHWKIPVDYVMENGRYLHFKNSGYEKQRFCSLEELEQFKVKTQENRRF